MLFSNSEDIQTISSSNKKTSSAGPRPFVKWAGGKRQLLDVLNEAKPNNYKNYHEPFVGGGAFLFSLRPYKGVIYDINAELINAYLVIRDSLHLLIDDLKNHINEEAYFYSIRALQPCDLNHIQRASRFIYLNKTCFNGLYRENSKGLFNTPFGKYKNPTIIDLENLKVVSDYLRQSQIDIVCGDYHSVLEKAVENDFVYFDPPYVPMSKTANFSTYTKGGFNIEDQTRLAELCKTLSTKGVFVMLSNSNTPIILELYKDFNIQIIHATRQINCVASKRGSDANEVLVTNY